MSQLPPLQEIVDDDEMVPLADTPFTPLPQPGSLTRNNSGLLEEAAFKSKITELYRSLKKDTVEKIVMENENLGDKNLARLASVLGGNNKKLSSLSIVSAGITHVGASALFKAMETNCGIQHLILDGNIMQPMGVWHLALAMQKNENLSLLTLSLGSCGLNEGASMNYLCEFLADNKVNIPYRLMFCFAHTIIFCQTLTALNISENGLTAAHACILKPTLNANTSITNLDVSANKLSSAGALEILVSDPTSNATLCVTLTHPLLFPPLILSALPAIQDGFARNSSLTTIDLSDNDIGAEAGRAIISCIQHHNPFIATLTLGFNPCLKQVEKIAYFCLFLLCFTLFRRVSWRV